MIIDAEQLLQEGEKEREEYMFNLHLKTCPECNGKGFTKERDHIVVCEKCKGNGLINAF